MDRLIEFEKTRKDVLAAIHEKNLFREEGLSGPISLTDALRMDMTSLAEGSGKIGWPATAWWWFVNDFYRPIGKGDIKALLPKDEEIDLRSDPIFKMPLVGPMEGRRTLTEFWESLGYETLRKERRSGRLAEKKAFNSGVDIPSGPSTEWLGLPKDFLKTKSNAMEVCKDMSLVEKMDALLDALKMEGEEVSKKSTESIRLTETHPLTKRLMDERSESFSEHALSYGPDDEVAAEILKLQETLLHQVIANRTSARCLLKAAMKNAKFEQKQSLRKEKLEKEIGKCQRIIENHERKKKEENHKTEVPSTPVVKEVFKKETEPDTNPSQSSIPKLVSHSNQAQKRGPPSKQSVPSKKYPITIKDLFQSVVFSKEPNCDVCGLVDDLSSMLECRHCGIRVHPRCYSSSNSSTLDWRCLPCQIYHERQRGFHIKSAGLKSGGALSVECKVCPRRGGAYTKTQDNKKWIHTICGLALSDPVMKVSAVIKRCCICGKVKGKAFPCMTPDCTSVLHVFCAKVAGKLVIGERTENEEKKLMIETMLCNVCGKRDGQEWKDLEGTEASQEWNQTPKIKMNRVMSRLETASDPILDAFSEPIPASSRSGFRGRSKRNRDASDMPKVTRRLKSKRTHSQDNLTPMNTQEEILLPLYPPSPDQEMFFQSSPEPGGESRRLTRSMR